MPHHCTDDLLPTKAISGLSRATKVYSGVGADIVVESISLTTRF